MCRLPCGGTPRHRPTRIVYARRASKQQRRFGRPAECSARARTCYPWPHWTLPCPDRALPCRTGLCCACLPSPYLAMTEIQDAAFVGLNIDQWQVEEALPGLSGSGKDRFFMARRSGASRIMQFVPETSIHERLFSWQPRDARFEWLANDDATRAGIMPLRLASSIAVRGQTFLVLGYDAMNLGGSRWLADMLTRPAERTELSLDDFLLMARAVCGALDYLGSNGKSLAHCNVRPSAVLFLPELTAGEGRFRVFR